MSQESDSPTATTPLKTDLFKIQNVDRFLRIIDRHDSDVKQRVKNFDLKRNRYGRFREENAFMKPKISDFHRMQQSPR